jgi:microcystin-dependent protein
MTVETATLISDLNPLLPDAADGLTEGDNHIRLLKSAIQATFPNINAAITATDEQLNSAALLAFAGLLSTGAANKLAYFTSSSVMALTDITAAARTLLDDADVAAMRTTLELGTAALVDVGTDEDEVPQLGADGRVAVAQGGMPTGVVLPYAGVTEPTGYLLCYGQAVSRTTYAALFTAIGSTYGSGDGSTTFNLPDLRGRVVAGQDDMGGSSANRLTGTSGSVNGDTLGAAGGAETHTLTEAQIPAHDHQLQTSTAAGADSAHLGVSHAGTLNANKNTENAGGGGAHNNVQPTIILNYIIKT